MLHTIKNNDTMFIRIKNFDNAKEFIANGFDGEKIVGVVGGTGTNGWIFRCYVNASNTALLLLGGLTAAKFYEKSGKQVPMHISDVGEYYKKYGKKTSKTTNQKSSKKTSKKPSKETSKKIKKSSRKTSRKTSIKQVKKSKK